MDLKKPFFLDHLLSSLSLKRRLLSGCGLGLLASLLLFSLLSTLNTTPPPSAVTSSSSSSSSFISWVFSISAASPSNSSSSSSSSSSSNTPHLFNSSGLAIVEPVSEKTHDGNSSSNCSFGKELDLCDAHFENSSSLAHQEPIFNRTHDGSGEQAIVENAHSANISSKDVGVKNVSKKATEEDCNIFSGRWVRDEREAFYPGGSCPYIDNDFNCHKNGRPDDEFLKWRWQPNDCHIPRMNATDFLARLKGKRLLFVGDSLNRNMWESLVCILRHSVERKDTVYEASGRHDFKTKGYYSFRFEDYNCSLDYVRSPFLVRELFFKNANGSDDERLRLDLLDETTSAYREADIVIFNTGHWWTHEKTSRGIDYYQEGNHVYPLLKVMKAYEKALTTWARWVDKNINSSKTQVVFRGYSVTHFRGGQWNSGGQCHKETEPIFNETFLAKYPSKMRVFERVMEQMKTPVIYLNISRLTDYRKDGHPSIYRKTYNTVEEHLAAEKSQDCSHWCLPGIPDTWNELLYASLLRNGKESWAR